VVLQTGKPWNEVQRGMALDLLGVGPEFREVRYANATTVETQDELARQEIARLKRQQTEWLDGFDTYDRAAAVKGLAFPDRAVWLVRRYEMASARRFHVALRHLMAKGVKAPGGNNRATKKAANRPEGAASPPSAGFSTVVIQPEPADPFNDASDKEKIDEAVARLRAECEARGKVAPAPALKPIPAVEDAFEEALASPAPAPMKGNRRYRKMMQRLARQRKS
jgi:hypothetical protein